MLKGSLYAERLPIGKEEVIMNFKRQSIVDFFNDWYRPDLQAIVIVGDLQDFEYKGFRGDQAMEQRVRDVFGTHAKAVNPKQRPSFSIPDNKEPLVAIATDKEVTYTNLSIYWKHPKGTKGTIGDFRRGIVRSLASMMMNDRFREICENPQTPMTYASGYYTDFMGRNTDVFEINCNPKESRIEDAATVILTELKRIVQHGFLPSEFERQKEEMLSWYINSANEAEKREHEWMASEYSYHFLEGYSFTTPNDDLAILQALLPGITLDECNQMMRSYVTDENAIFYLTAPESDAIVMPDSAKAVEILASYNTIETEPWIDDYVDEPLFSEEVLAVTPQVTHVNSTLDYTEYTCPNGIRFIVKKTDYQADEIIISSFAPGGTSLYSDEEAYTANNASRFITSAGVGNFNSTQLSKRLKGKNVWMNAYVSGMEQNFSGSTTPKDLETALQLINMYYTAPRKDREKYNQMIEEMVDDIKHQEENPSVQFNRTIIKTCYPVDPRRVLVPTEEKIRSLDLDRMYEIYRERFTDASNQIFFFVGNVSDSAINLIARYLNHLPVNGKQRNETFVYHIPKFAEGIVHAETVKGMERKGAIYIFGEMMVDSTELTPEVRFALNAFSAALEITITEVIREKNGDAYSPSVSVGYGLRPGVVEWEFYIGCDPEKAAKIEKDCIKIMKKYIKRGPDEKTLAKVKEQMIINNGTNKQNNWYWQSIIESAYTIGESRDYMVRYDEMVRAVTSKQIRDLARKYINLKNYVVVSLRPENPDAGMAD